MTSLNLFTLQVQWSGLTAATTAYTADDTLGAIQTFTIPGSSTGCVIHSAVLEDKANIIGAVDAYIYDRSVTLASDNAAWSVSDADGLFKLGQIPFPSATAETANRSAHVDSMGIVVIPNASSQFFVGLATRGAHTFFGASTDLVLRLSGFRDA